MVHLVVFCMNLNQSIQICKVSFLFRLSLQTLTKFDLNNVSQS
jgi:hypothetical protein